MVARNYPATGVYLVPTASPNSKSSVAAQAKGIYSAYQNATDPAFVYPSFYSIGSRTFSFRTRRGRSYELGRAESGEAQLRVDNSDRLFDPTNTSSPLFGNLKPFRGLCINAAHNGVTAVNTSPLTGNFINDTNTQDYTWTSPLFPGSGWSGSLALGVTSNDATAEISTTNNWWIRRSNSTYANLSRSNTRAWSGTFSYSNSIDAANIQYVCLDVPVVAGRQYAVSAYAYVGAGSPTMSVWDGVAFRTGASASASVNLSGAAFNRYTLTVTPTSPRICLVFTLPANAQIWFDGVQVEIGSTASTFTTTGPTVHSLFNGFVERYPQSFLSPARGEANLVATDLMASMSQVTMDSAYVADVLSYDPLYYYPLDSEDGASYAGNFSAYNQLSLLRTTESVKTTGTPGTMTFGNDQAAAAIPAAGTTGCAFDSDSTSSSFTYLEADNLPDILFSAVPGLTGVRSYTIDCWFKGDAYSATEGMYPWRLIASDGTTNAYVGTVAGSFRAAMGYTGGTSVVHGALTAGTWYFSSSTFIVDPSSGTGLITIKSSLNGGTILTDVAAGTATNNSSLQIGRGSKGVVAHVAVYQGDLSATAAARYQVGVSAYSGELLSTRFSRLFSLAGFDYPTLASNASISYASALTDCAGKNLFDVAQETADSEAGTWFVAGNGTTVFNNRRYRTTQITPKYTFADSAAGTAYKADEIVLNNDPTFILNDISITRSGGVTSNAYDSQSTVDYFPRTYSRTLYNDSDLEAIDCAFYLLDRYKDPSLRADSVTLTPSSNPTAWLPSLLVELDDLVLVRKAQYLAGTFWDLSSFVERIEHEVDGTAGIWNTSIYVSPKLKDYNFAGALNTTLNTASIVGASSLVLDRGTLELSDFPAGLLLEIEPASSTANEHFIVAGTPTQTGTTITVPVAKVTATASTTISASSSSPEATTLSLTDFTQVSGATRILVGLEVMTCTAISSNTVTVTARGQNGTNPQRHFAGEPVYALPATLTLASAHAANVQVCENLPAGDTDPTVNPFSQLQSALVTVAGVKTTTGNYTTLPFYGLLDYNNTPSSDFAIGTIFELSSDNFVSSELAALVVAPPTTVSTNQWVGTFYRVASSGVLASDLTIDGTTVILGAASPAGTIAVVIDNEFMQVTAGAGTSTLTVVRGTPDAAVWAKLNQAPHRSRNSTTAVRFLVAGGLTGTYAANNLGRAFGAQNTNYIRLAY